MYEIGNDFKLSGVRKIGSGTRATTLLAVLCGFFRAGRLMT
jgi:hypothetical protein